MKNPTKEELLSIGAAEQLLAIRDKVNDVRPSEETKFVMFTASNQISKLYGNNRTKTKDNCNGCLPVLRKQLNNWFSWYDEAMEPTEGPGPEEVDQDPTGEEIPTQASEEAEGIIEADQEEETEPENPGEIVDVTKLSWNDLQKFATSKGIAIKGKNKATILNELAAL